jgi:HEAT repeat protein
MVVLVAAMFLTTQATHAYGSNAADALFFSRFGVEFLPHLFLGLGFASAVVTLAFTTGLARLDSRRLLPSVLVGGAAVMLAQRIGVALDVPGIYSTVWLVTNLVTLTTFALMWNVAASVCDARQAKRLFAVFAAAGILGGVVGNFTTGPLAAILGTEDLLLVVAALLAVSAFLTSRIGATYITVPTRGSRQGSIADDIRAGYRAMMRSTYFRTVALAAALAMVLFYSVAFPFSEAAAEQFTDETDLAGFLGTFSGVATVSAFFVSLFVAGRVYQRIGVVGSVLVLPLTYIAGLSLWIVSFDLTTATIVRGAQWVVVMGLSATAFNALFNVSTPENRRQLLTFVLGVAGQLGVSIAGALLLAGSWIGDETIMFSLSLVLAIGYAWVVWSLRPKYAAQLLAALRSGLTDPFDAAHQSVAALEGHADVVAVVATALDDEHPAARRLATEILGRIGAAAALPLLERALNDVAPDVRRTAVLALDRIGGRETALIGADATADPDPSVRAAAVGLLAHHAPDLTDRFVMLAADPHPWVRGRAAVGLFAAGRTDDASEVIDDLLASDDADARRSGLDAAADCDGVTADVAALFIASDRRELRTAAVRALAASRSPDATALLITTCSHPDEPTARAAAAAIRQRGVRFADIASTLESGTEAARRLVLGAVDAPADSARLVTWAKTRIDDAVDLHQRIQALGSETRSLSYLGRVLREREWDIERTILEALAQADHRPALALVKQGLDSADSETRAQALEALDALSDRSFSQPLLSLLDTRDVEPATAESHDVLRLLISDCDPLVRALALQASHDVDPAGGGLQPLPDDDHPLVTDTAQRLATRRSDRVRGDMADTLDTLGTVERVLLLQDVPIFSTLTSEDLVAIAGVAGERLLPDGHHLVRQGDDADELFLIISGTVEVRANGDVELAQRGPGDPVGELAIITRSKRSADVVTRGDVRILVVHADAFEAILEDRPTVARAMLSVVAERLAEAV